MAERAIKINVKTHQLIKKLAEKRRQTLKVVLEEAALLLLEKDQSPEPVR